MHTILGAGGPVADALTRILIKENIPVRLVSRSETKFSAPNVNWQKADLLNYQEVLAAIKGSDVFYLTAGLAYDIKIWQQQWPVIMNNMINAAKETGIRFIFFDNVYMYGLVNGPMTEDTPYNPSSIKGEVRAKIATKLMDEAKSGNINATILRGADFYGADSMNSFIDSMVLAKYAGKARAMWIGNVNCRHNFTYVPDCGTALYLLGTNDASANQMWHAPTQEAITGKEFLQIAAQVFDTQPKYFAINKFMLQLIGLFDKTVKGTVEMYYQYDHDYVFNSSKFQKYFNIEPATYRTGITELSQTLFKTK